MSQIRLIRNPNRKKFVIGFTGHRPQHMGHVVWGSALHFAILRQLKFSILKVMEAQALNGVTEFQFVMGGAIGIDQMAFQAVWEIREALGHKFRIKIIVSVPFENQDSKWGPKDCERYRTQLMLADNCIYVDGIPAYQVPGVEFGEFHKKKLLDRNKHMVNMADLMIAVWNGRQGGTSHCINYANSRNVPVVIIKPMTHRDILINRTKG